MNCFRSVLDVSVKVLGHMEVVAFQQVPPDGVEGVHEFFAANFALVMFHGGHDVAMGFGVLFKAQAVSTVDVS